MKIQYKLIITFLVIGLAPLFIVGFYSYQSGQSALQRSIGGEFAKSANEALDKIDRGLFERLENIKAWASLEIMQDIFTDDVDGRISNALTRFQEGYGAYHSIHCINDDGIVVTSTDPTKIGKRLEFKKEVDAALQGKVNYSDVVPIDNTYGIVFSAPVYVGPIVIGALVSVFDWSQVNAIIDGVTAKDNEAEGTFVVMLNREGSPLAESESLRESGSPARSASTWTHLQSLQRATMGENDFLVEDAGTFGEMLIGFSHSRGYRSFHGNDWTLLVLQNTEKAFEPVRSLRNKFFIIGLAAMLLIVVVAFGMAKTLSRPLLQITRAAEDIAGGNYDLRVEIESKDEVGLLARAFNHMAESISKSKRELEVLNESLEQKVEERTEELQKANEELKKLEELKSSFLSTASHELRTPLTSVLGFAKMIHKRFEKDIKPAMDLENQKARKSAKKITDNLQIIISEGERLSRLINDVLDIAKIEAGKIEWNMEPLQIEDIIKSSVFNTHSLASEKGLEVTIDAEEDLPMVKGDRDRIIQVVTNLLSNAIKFTDEGSIECLIRKRDGEVDVRIKDSGIGIAEEDLDKVFGKFQQVGDTLTDKPKGTGLGLPICKEIIEHHEGRIWVESEFGVGSTFGFTVPILSPEESILAKEIHAMGEIRRRVTQRFSGKIEGKRTILVVDDEENIRNLIRQELEGEGFEVVEAADGEEAVSKAREIKPDLIILDILMPRLSGYDVTSILKNDEDTANIPILILSIVEDKEKGFRLGASEYLSKPIDFKQLLSSVSDLIGSSDPSQKHAQQRKILVIDPDASVIESIADTLQAKGYEVVAAYNGIEGVKKATEILPDLIIVDDFISRDNNYELLKALKFKGAEKETIIIITGGPDAKSQHEAEGMKADIYMNKEDISKITDKIPET